ncbi:hypothetical protein ILUMI_14075, partial [Ignelater luminosus]
TSKLYHKKYNCLKKNIKSQANKTCLEKSHLFRISAEKLLFDICSCKCKDFKWCSCRNKVPEIERSFLIDQRTSRKMIIGGVDVKTTLKLQKTKERKEREAERLKTSGRSFRRRLCDDSDISCSDPPWKAISNPKIQIEDDLSEMVPSTSANLHTRRIKLPTLAEACDRTGVSDPAASILVSLALKDLGMKLKSAAVERCIKLVTDASGTVCGEDTSDGFITKN